MNFYGSVARGRILVRTAQSLSSVILQCPARPRRVARLRPSPSLTKEWGILMGCCGDFGIQSRGKRATSGHKCRLCVIWHIIKGDGVPGGDPCVVIPGHVIDKPDPCIYDQFLLMQLNEPVTWDNPDVRIFLNGVEQYTYNLTVATEYDVKITVHNSSRNRPATGTSVAVRWIEFGAGGQIRHPIATLTANVPTWPSSRVVATKWTTPAAPGHYCIEVELAHPDDGNPSNNRGWNNTQVYAAHSPATLPIRIFNTQPGDCPPVSEGGGPVLRPHRIFLGWGPIGAVIALLLQDRLAEHVPRSLAFLTLLAAGYVTLSVVGLAEASSSPIAASVRARFACVPGSITLIFATLVNRSNAS